MSLPICLILFCFNKYYSKQKLKNNDKIPSSNQEFSYIWIISRVFVSKAFSRSRKFTYHAITKNIHSVFSDAKTTDLNILLDRYLNAGRVRHFDHILYRWNKHFCGFDPGTASCRKFSIHSTILTSPKRVFNHFYYNPSLKRGTHNPCPSCSCKI